MKSMKKRRAKKKERKNNVNSEPKNNFNRTKGQ